MKKKLLSTLMCVVMGLSLLTGCGSKPAKEEKQPENNEQVESVTKDGTVSYNVDLSKYEKGKVVRLWLPVAQSNEYQTVEDVKFDAGDAKAELTKDDLGNQMLYVEWGKEAENRKVDCSFHVSRKEVVAPEFVEDGEIGEDMSEYLEASSTIPVDGIIKEKADEITKDKKTVLEKARAIYDWVIANMNRDESVVGCGKGDVCTLLDTKGGKCTDINSMFVGLCRAAGIPAREMFGVRMNDADITKNQHCWAEFYLHGTGWVLADPADVLKAVLKNNWDKSSEEAKEKREFYWGNSEAERVELSRGRDVKLNPAQDGEALNNFGYPYAEVDGSAVDFYKPDEFIYTISFAEDK